MRACRNFCVLDLGVQIFLMLETRRQSASEGIEKCPGHGSEEVHKTGSWREY